MKASDIKMMEIKIRLLLESDGIWAHMLATVIRKHHPEGLVIEPQDLADTQEDARLMMVHGVDGDSLEFKLITREEAEAFQEKRKQEAELAQAPAQGSA